MRIEYIKINGKTYTVYRIRNSSNGNPRYLISWMELGLNSYSSTKKTRQAGIVKYIGKKFVGCFLFESYSLEEDLKFIIETIKGE